MMRKNASHTAASVSARNVARRRRTALALAGVSLLGLVLAPGARAQTMPAPTALPSGGTVVAGSVQIATDGATMTVDQATARGIINWQRFDIGEQGSVVFRQPDANAVTLNRVISGAGSTIAGRMSANGKVYVVNPNGVLFSNTAQVDVGGLVASTADIADVDFLAGRDVFALGGATGSIVNDGRITTAPGGSVVLIGGTVTNNGAIRAEGGDVALTAGSKVTLDAGADGHLKIEVDGATTRTLVQNGGLIAANGGNVLLRAEAADAAISSVVANTGTIEARTLANRSGRVLLLADMAGGLVAAGGTIDASAPDGGDGGFVETSAASLSFAPDLNISTLAAAGQTGTWLIDPYDITISAAGSNNITVDVSGSPWSVSSGGSGANINNSTLAAYLSSSNVAIRTVGAGSEAGNITVTAPVSWSAATTLSLLADSTTGGVFVNANINGSHANSAVILSAGSGGISQANGTIQAGTLTATTANGGNVILTDPGNAITRLGTSSSSGTFSLISGAAMTVTGSVRSGGALSLRSTSDLTIDTALTDSRLGLIMFLTADGKLTITKDLTLSGSDAWLRLTSGSGYVLSSGARVTLSGANADLRINNQAYTLIHDINALQAVTGSGLYALANDLDASATAAWNSGSGFAPITGFTGTFAGMGHIVDSLTINRPLLSQTGLFGDVNSATIRDITLSNVSINGLTRVGALAGFADYSTISNVHVTGTVRSSQEVGGIVGWLSDSALSGSSSSASVTASGPEAGGLVGRGYYGTSITNSYATGAVTASDKVGGLIGGVEYGSPFTLTNVYASGRVTGGTNTGGLIGANATGSTVTSTNAYWDIDTTGQATNATGGGVTGITSANARTQATYAGFDFTNTWIMIAGETRPMLRNEYSTVIATGAALQLMETNKSASYTLGANLDLTSAFTADGNGNYAGLWGESGFFSIGMNFSNDGRTFTGSFDGANRSITGLRINRSTTDYVGFFGYADGATIANITLTGGSVTGNSQVGALVGYMQGGTLSNAGATTTVVGISTGESNSGGLVGTNRGGAISDSWASGTVTGAGYQVGGLAGFNFDGGTITRSYATGAVTGTSTTGNGYLGGLVGGNGYSGDGGTISQSYATGTVTGASGPIGGFVGHNDGTITDSYATGVVIGTGSAANVGGFVGVNFVNGTINAAYSTGRVTGATNVGGFAGYNNNGAGAITNAYWNTQTSGQSTGIFGGSGSATARTTAQLQGSLPSGFSSSIWRTGDNLYPYFGWRYSTTPVAVSGIASASAGGSALAGSTVTAISNGALLGSAVTGDDGYYYILAPASGLSASGVLTYLDGGATLGAAFSDALGTNGVQNIALYGTAMHLITGQASLTATRTNYLAARGSYADTDLSFLGSNFAPLTTTAGYGLTLDASGNYALDTGFTSSGALSLSSGGTFGLNSSVTLSAGGALTIGSAISWSNGSTLSLSTTGGGAITLNGAVTGTAGGLTLAGSGTITAGAIDVSAFRLTSGNWRQVAASLPSFAATNFMLDSGGSFLRATGGDGTSGTPYQIADLFGLQGLASTSLLAQHFVLAADINATPAAVWNSGAGFLPIGNATTAFNGSLDGAGHSIGGLTIARPTISAGLFGQIGSGSVSNLTVAGSVRGLNAGLLAGANEGTISNVATYGSVGNTGAASAGSLGGIVGTSSGTITGSTSSASVTGGDYSVVGGLVGLNDGFVIGSYATGAVTAGVDGRAGGLVGHNSSGTIEGSFATGNATASASNAQSGGLVGLNAGDIVDSYATGIADAGAGDAGGLVGANFGRVTKSFATGTVSSTSSRAGGLIGSNSGTVNSSFWNTTSSGTTVGAASGATAGITGRTTAEMTSLATFSGAGWSIDDAGGTASTWRIYAGFTAPLLRSFMTALTVTGGSGSKAYDGSATSTNVGTLTYSPSGYTTSLVSGTASYTASSANAATYTGAGLTLSGLYSSQLGYDISLVSGSLVISPVALTVTAANATKTYDGLAFSGGNGVTYSGFVNGETASVLGGMLSYGGTAQGAVNAGSYGLTASGLTSANYTIGYTAGTLVVNPAALTVTAANATKTYNGLAWSGGNGVTYSGFVNGETASVLGGTLAYGGTAQGATNAGSYGLSASGLTSGNYTIGYTSGTLVVNPAALTVTATNATKTYDGLAWSGGNGVSYSGFVNGETAAVLGGTLAYGGTAQGAINAGSYGLSASGLTSANYTIGYAAGTLLVNPAALTVTAANATKTYDGLAFSGGNGVTYSGFVNAETASVLGGTLSYGGTAQGAVNAGSYGLTASGLTSGNYTIGYTAGTLLVNPAALTVTANNATKTYDGLAFSGGNGVTYSGFVNGETASVLGGTLTYGGTAQGAVNAGSYGLTASGLTSGNYTIGYTPGTLLVNPASLTVTATNATKTYDGLAFSGGNGVTYSGFVNGETAAVLGGTLTYGGTAQGAVNAGSYGLTASGLTSSNYTIGYTAGTLLVNRAALTVTAANASKTYDGLAFSGGNGVTYSGFVNGETASVLGGTLTYGGTAQGAVNAGSYWLTASGLTSSNYTIGYTAGTLLVNPAALTVTAANATKTYDGLAWSGGNGVTYSGFVNAETASVLGGTLSYGGTAQGAVNAGSYGLSASGLTSSNYTIGYTAGTLVVNPAALTVTAANATKTYNGLAFSGGNGVTYSGFANGETAAVLGGTLAYGGTAQGAINAGSYGLSASGLTSSNYTIGYTAGTLLVNPAALTVTATNATKTYDGLAWSGGNGVTYSGFVNGETAAVLGGTLAYGGTAQGSINAGSYGLSASGLTATNYTIGYTSGTLVVNPAALTVTAGSLSIPLLGNYLPLQYRVEGTIAPRDAGASIFGGVLATEADNSLPGSYAITLGTLRVVNPNYVLSRFTGGTIEVQGPTNTPDGGVVEQTLPVAALPEAIGSVAGRVALAGSGTATLGRDAHLKTDVDFIRVEASDEDGAR
ncbi:MBG domain-containing protein [Sphingomonas sp. CJ20]